MKVISPLLVSRPFVLAVLLCIARCGASAPAPAGTIPAETTVASTATPALSSTPTASSTFTAAPARASTATATPSATPAPAPSPTRTPTRVAVPTPFLPDTLVGPLDLRQPVAHVPWFRSDGLWWVDPETGDRQRAQMEALAAAWSPEGGYLAVLGPPLPGQEAPPGARVLTLYDLAAGQRRTYPNVYLAPQGNVAWQETGGAPFLYALPAGEPACLLRFDLDRGAFQQVLCAGEKGERFAGDIVALPDGRLAHTVVAADRLHLRLVDPATGAVQEIPLWTGSEAASALRVPLSLSPDGRFLAALRGPDADPGGGQSDQRGLYLLDVDAGIVEQAFTQPGLRWMAWSPDGAQLALAGDSRRFGMNAIYLYNRATGAARALDEAVNHLHLAFFASSPVSDHPTSAYPVGIPLAWTGDGRLLVGLHLPSNGGEIVHPRLAWVDPATEAVTFALPFEREPGDWPVDVRQEVGLAVRYPPGWVVGEWQAHGDVGLALGSTTWVPARYASVQAPQLPHVGLALYRPPLTGTLEAWLETHGTAAPFGTQSGPEVGFWGVGDAVPAAAGGYPALRFTHEVFGLRVHELLLAVGDRVVGLGYVDMGGEDLGLAFAYMQMELAPAEVALPAGWGAGGDLAERLVVEEYPIVAQEVDSPGHFEYLDRIGDEILDRRRDWRQARDRGWHGTGDPPPVVANGETIALHVDPQHALLTVSSGGKPIYAMSAPWPWVDDPVKAFQSWRGHWVLEANEQVIVDGQSLNRALGYDALFGWGLVQDRPFFFFRDGDTYGVSYDGQVLPYRYDQIVHDACCEPATFNAAGNETMVWFHALRDGVWVYVEMGVYE